MVNGWRGNKICTAVSISVSDSLAPQHHLHALRESPPMSIKPLQAIKAISRGTTAAGPGWRSHSVAWRVATPPVKQALRYCIRLCALC